MASCLHVLNVSEPVNQHSLDIIETSQFVLCLDQTHPHTSQLLDQSIGSDSMQDYHKTILANNVLHGNGSRLNSSNRWFDHAYQVRKIIILFQPFLPSSPCLHVFIHVQHWKVGWSLGMRLRLIWIQLPLGDCMHDSLSVMCAGLCVHIYTY